MGQTKQGNYQILPLKDLSSFEKNSTNWSIQEDIAIHPFINVRPKFRAGEGILVGTQGAMLTSKMKASDLKMRLEFMVSPGAEGYFILPGGQKILISDSYRTVGISNATSGYISQFPKQNAAKAPGLWQSLEFAYDATVPNLPRSSRLNTLNMNGVNLIESIYLTQPKGVSGPQGLSLEVTKGTIAFRNIGYQLLENSKTLSLKNLSYKVYSDNWDVKNYKEFSHEGKSPILTQEVGNGIENFHLVYEGDIQVDESGEYTFSTNYTGGMFDLDVDGKPLINKGESGSHETHKGTVSLTKGVHRFKLHYSRFPWSAPAMGLVVEKPGVRPYNLHALSSLPQPAPQPHFEVEATERPEMVRSFIQLDGEKYKRTHCISVGTPSGWNYTMDLNRGALIRAWRGKFADVTDMWYSRGEPQLLAPQGLVGDVSGKSSLATLTSAQAAWPDSSNISFKGYNLDKSGFPYFKYDIAGTEIADHLTSDSKQITRTFQFSSPTAQPVFVLAATGKKIVQVEPGLYQVDDRYYVQFDKKSKFNLREIEGQQELILPVNHQSTYHIFW
jgi:hypothetical protein